MEKGGYIRECISTFLFYWKERRDGEAEVRLTRVSTAFIHLLEVLKFPSSYPPSLHSTLPSPNPPMASRILISIFGP